MDSRNTYWSLMHDCKFKEFYIEEYHRLIKIIDLSLKGITMFASAGSVAAWSIWQKVPALWGALIVISQVIQIVYPLLPYSKQSTAYGYMLPELKKLILDIEVAWLRSENDSDEHDVIALFQAFKERYNELDDKYIGTDTVPEIKKVREIAEKRAENHLKLYFGATAEGDDTNGE